jgi:transketolase
MEAYQALMQNGIKTRVVSMPCWELFDEQDETYKESVLPRRVTARISIEAGTTLGWAKYVGAFGVTIGIDHFGASAPYEKLYEAFGLTAQHVIEAAHQFVG